MKHFKKKIVLVSILIVTGVLASSIVLAGHNSTRKQQCLRDAQRAYFVAIDRAMTTFTQRKNSCRQNITTVDNHLRCLNRANTRYQRDILEAKRRYRHSRWRCLNSLRLNRKNIKIHRPNLQLRR